MSRTHHPTSRAYVLCQVGGWGAYIMANAAGVLLVGAHHGFLANWVAGYLGTMSAGILITHGLRAVVLWRGWLDLSWWRIFPRLLGAGAVTGALLGSTLVAITFWAFPAGTVNRGLVFVYLVNSSALILLWLLLYVGVHSFRNYESARTAHLQMELVAQTTQLQLLRAQLNPHFLFNALNSIRALIQEDPHRAQDAVTQLSGILRHALAAERADTVPLHVEMDAVRDYLRLEEIRLEERLRTAIDLDARTLDLPIPSMLVQTLVENAIKHGISRRPGGGDLAVRSRLDDGGLRLEVVNSGRIADPATGTRVGLANARARLALLFGEEATVALENRDDDSVVATVCVPSRRLA
jgi:LytS/YehU family sensor histidine kinase